MFDGTALGQEIVTQTKAHIDRSLEPLAKRIAELEALMNGQPDIGAMVARAVAAIPVPQDGKDGEPGRDGSDGQSGEPGEPGKDGEPGSPGKDGEPGEPGQPGKDGKDGEPGRDGLDADQTVVPDDTAELVARAVRLMAEMPSAIALNVEETQRRAAPAQPPVHVHLPRVDIPPIVMPDSIAMQAPVVNVTMPEPKKRATETTVVSHDSKGRIKKFVQKEIG